METVKLWREGRQKFVGTVELDDNRRLFFHIDDEEERDRLASVFKDTGEVTWGWTQFNDVTCRSLEQSLLPQSGFGS
jgi:hypothetical protein